MGAKMPINVFDMLGNLDQERYRAVIFHAAPDKGPSITTFCKKICEQKKGKYLDLLEFFIQSPDLSETIDSFNPEKLRKLLIEQSRSQKLLIVDRIDFLLDTWRNPERRDFYRFADNQWDGYKDGMKAKLVLVQQTSLDIETLKIVDSQNNSRVFQLADFYDIA